MMYAWCVGKTVSLAPLTVLVVAQVVSCSRASELSTDPAAVAASTASLATAAIQAPGPVPPGHALPPGTPPAAFLEAMRAADAAIAASEYTRADTSLDAAAAAVGADAHLLFIVALYRATRFAYSVDYKRASNALAAVIPEAAKHPELPDEFSAHNQMMILLEAQGDPSAALAEDDQATAAAARGTWAPGERETLAYLKDRWHRAYLTRMLAQTRTGSARETLIKSAEAALDDYRTRARLLHTNEDSIAVLEAYFAALDGKRDAALRAARRVDTTKDDDMEDLYLVVVGLEAGGDHAGAEAVRQRMHRPGDVHISRPIMLRWADNDAKATTSDRAFTPWHPF
jgi:hypothetical protein